MISQREERTLRAFLGDEPPILPTHVWYAVMAEVPATRQRRHRGVLPLLGEARPAVRLLAVAVLLLLAIAGLVLVAGAAGWLRQPPPTRLFVGGEVPLEPGPYVVEGSFATLVGVDVPEGWLGSEQAPGIATLRANRTIGPAVVLTSVDAVYRDACDPNVGLQAGVGQTAADLGAALAKVKSVSATNPGVSRLGGLPAVHTSISAPAGAASCTTHPDEARYQLWGLPYSYGLGPGWRAEIWAVEVGDERLVAVLEIPEGTEPDDAAAATRIVNSIRFGVPETIVLTPAPTGTPAPEPTWPPIVEGAVLSAGLYALPIRLHAAEAGAVDPGLSELVYLALPVPDGWVGTAHGVVAADGGASIEVWSVRAIRPDPCRWRTSLRSVVPGDLEALGLALGTAWVRGGSGEPSTSGIPDPPFNGAPARLVDLSVPENLDPAACDGGELRAWEDRDGTTRLLRPGEQVRLRIVDLEPGLAVLAFGTLADAPIATRESARGAWESAALIPEAQIPPAPSPSP